MPDQPKILGGVLKKLFLTIFVLLVSCGKTSHPPKTIQKKDLDFILGDKVSSSNQFASVVQIITKDIEGNKVSACSGTVVCENNRKCLRSSLVKTSAHCFLNDDFISMQGPSILNGLLKSGAIKNNGANQLVSVEPFFSFALESVLYQNIEQFIQNMEIRSYKDQSIRTHEFKDVQINPKWISYYRKLIVANLTQNQADLEKLFLQKREHAGLDQAYLRLKQPLSDIPIYREAGPEDLKDYLTEGQEIIISGWGLNQEDFNFGIVPFGQNGAHPINNKRLETKVKIKATLDENNFFYVGSFSDLGFGIKAFQQGACSGDSGGGAFLKIMGEIRHIGTITAIQPGLCGTKEFVDQNGKKVEPFNDFHTMILAW